MMEHDIAHWINVVLHKYSNDTILKGNVEILQKKVYARDTAFLHALIKNRKPLEKLNFS